VLSPTPRLRDAQQPRRAQDRTTAAPSSPTFGRRLTHPLLAARPSVKGPARSHSGESAASSSVKASEAACGRHLLHRPSSASDSVLGISESARCTTPTYGEPVVSGAERWRRELYARKRLLVR